MRIMFFRFADKKKGKFKFQRTAVNSPERAEIFVDNLTNNAVGALNLYLLRTFLEPQISFKLSTTRLVNESFEYLIENLFFCFCGFI